MSSLKTLFAVGILSVLLAAGLPASVSADSHEGISLDQIEFGASIRARGNHFDYDETADEVSFFEQRTMFDVTAHVEDNVKAFVQFDSYDNWGEDFRSDPITGVDNPDGDDIGLYQAFIDVENIGDAPVMLRVGRQELQFGSEFLVGNNDVSSYFYGLSFDGGKLVLGEEDGFNATVFGTKLAESFNGFGEDDAEFYGVYTNYGWCENHDIDAYWLWVRDDSAFSGGLGATGADIHTIGARAAGMESGVDYEAELAYQFGEQEFSGASNVDYGSLALNLLLGYTFDASWDPRVFVGFTWLGGDDEDLSFNRLFSDWRYTEFDLNNNFTNLILYHWGFGFAPDDAWDFLVHMKVLTIDEAIDDEMVGFENDIYATYHYSDYLQFRGGWSFLSADDGAYEGNAVPNNGLAALTVAEDDFWHYLWLETMLSF